MNTNRLIHAPLLGLLIALLIGTPAAAQSVWLGPDRQAEVALEVLRPDFAEGMDATLLSSAVFLSGRYPLSDAVDVVAEIPITHFGVDGPAGTESETALGNPYLGVELGPHEGSAFGELGVRLPVATDNNGLVTGFLSDRDRWGAFSGDVLTIRGAVNYLHRASSGFRLRLHGGPSIWVYTGDTGGDSAELLTDYGAHAWYAASEQVHLSAGVTGRIIVSESDIDFADRMINQFGLAVIGRFERVHPGLHVRLPFDFDGASDETSYVLGLSLAVPLAP